MKITQIGFFDTENRYERIMQLRNPLEQLNGAIDWEMFREKLTAVCQKEDYTKGGCPPIDVIVKFKASVLHRIYNLSFDQIEYQINDRLSFMRFLGLGLGEKVLDSRTLWDFENTLAEAEIIDKLFCMFDDVLKNEGLITHKRAIVYATFAEAPKQHNSRDENKKIKNNEIPEEWEKPENAPKLAQKDSDARWAKKGKEVHFGYKDHVEKGVRNHPLTEEQKENNCKKSKTRCRIEHIFGFMANSMHVITIRSIGIIRAWFNIGIMNLIYNFCRYEFLKYLKPSRG